MAVLDLSGLTNVANAIGNVGNTFAQIGVNKYQQSKQYKFEAMAQKANMDLEMFAQQQSLEFQKNWTTPDFDRENATENYTAALQDYYDSSIRPLFDEDQAAIFEAQVLYPAMAQQQSAIQANINNFELQTGHQAHLAKLDQSQTMLSRGANFQSVLDEVNTSIDALRSAGYFATDVEAEEERRSRIHALNLTSAERNISALIDRGAIDGDEAEALVDAVWKGKPELSTAPIAAQRILDQLHGTEGLDNFTYQEAEDLKTMAVSRAAGRESEKDSQLREEAYEVETELIRLDTESPVSVQQVRTLFSGRTDHYSVRLKSEWMKTAKANDDDRLLDQMLNMASFVNDGTITVEDLESDTRWSLFHNKQLGKELKEDYVAVAKNHSDTSAGNALLEKYSGMDLVEGDEGSVQSRRDAVEAGEIISKKDEEILVGMYDQELAQEIRTSIEEGHAGLLQEIRQAKTEATQEARYLEIEETLLRANQSPEKDSRLIAQAYLAGEITEKQRDDLETTAREWKNSDAYTQALKDFDVMARIAAGVKETGALTLDEQARVNRYRNIYHNTFKNTLDRYPDQDTDDFVREIANELLNTDPVLLDFIQYTRGDNSTRYWEPGKSTQGRDDFDRLVWTLNTSNEYTGAGLLGEAYDMARAGAYRSLVELFGEQEYSFIPDSLGPLYELQDPSEVPEIVEILNQIDPGADPAKTPIALQYGIVEGSKNHETMLYIGVQTQPVDSEGRAVGSTTTKWYPFLAPVNERSEEIQGFYNESSSPAAARSTSEFTDPRSPINPAPSYLQDPKGQYDRDTGQMELPDTAPHVSFLARILLTVDCRLSRKFAQLNLIS